MKFVVQRVTNAEVVVEEKSVGKIKKGLLVLVGMNHSDNKEIADKMLKKLIQLRIFQDDQDKTNLSLQDVKGELLLISQFTLYADCRKGNRPSFTLAGAPEPSKELFDYIVQKAKDSMDYPVECGIFGADMKVSFCNDGPFTIVLDSCELGMES